MRVIVCDHYDEMSKEAARIMAHEITLCPKRVLGLATGSTPVGMYREMCAMYKRGEIDFSGVTTFNLDEYYPIRRSNPQSYHYFMQEQLFRHVNIPEKNIHIPDGEAADPEKACKEYEAEIAESGGIDLQVLGIGVNGHIGFNEPAGSLVARTHLTDLTESTIKANARFFKSEDEVPKHAVTMGVATILQAKKILLLANGKNKHDAIRALLSERISTSNPATFLNLHPDVTVICDKEAYGENDS